MKTAIDWPKCEHCKQPLEYTQFGWVCMNSGCKGKDRR